jgi:hypothetical protein
MVGSAARARGYDRGGTGNGWGGGTFLFGRGDIEAAFGEESAAFDGGSGVVVIADDPGGLLWLGVRVLTFLMQLRKRTKLSIYHFTGSILQVSYLHFPKGRRISIMSKTNIESN